MIMPDPNPLRHYSFRYSTDKFFKGPAESIMIWVRDTVVNAFFQAIEDNS